MRANMEIEYNLSPEDIVVYFYYQFLRNPIIQHRLKISRIICFSIGAAILVLGIGILFIISKLGVTVSFSFTFLIVFMGFLIIAYGIVIEAFTKNQYVKAIRKQFSGEKNILLGVRKLSINKDGLVDKNEVKQSSSSWIVVKEVISHNKHLFIVEKDDLDAVIVPKIAFPDEAAFNTFYETARQYHQAALKSSPQPAP